jgi:hypothetical protein
MALLGAGRVDAQDGAFDRAPVLSEGALPD